MKIASRTSLTIITFLAAFIIYILTAAPDVSFTDSGELAGVCATLGIAHPTGYPLFAILGFLWTKLPLPFSNIYSLNIFVAFLTAASAAAFFNIVYLILNYIATRKEKKPVNKVKAKGKPQPASTAPAEPVDNLRILLISFISALTYAFARTIWGEAISIEVYALELLLINLILLSFLNGIFNKDKEKKYFILTAFLIGLGFSNHMTTMLLLPAVLYLYFKRPGEKFDFSPARLKQFAILILPLLLGLSFYLYLPLRSASLPVFNWGWVSRGFDKLMYHISGKQYQVWMFTGSDSISKNFSLFLGLVPLQLAWLGLIPFAYGLYRAYKASGDLLVFLLLLVVGCLAYTLNYSIHDIDTYFSTAFIGIILLSGIGLFGLSKFTGKAYPAFIAIPLIALAINYNENDLSKDYTVSEYTRIIGDNLKPNAIIISRQWDYFCSAFWYKQQVEGYRKDVVLIEKELLRRTWYLGQFSRWYPQTAALSRPEMNSFLDQLELFESGKPYDPMAIQERFVTMLNSFIDKNYGKRPIYVTLDILEDAEDHIGDGYEKIPEGFAFRLEKEKKYYYTTADNINVDRFISSLRGKEGHLYDGIRSMAALNLSNIGRYALVSGMKDKAETAFRKALRIDPANEIAQQGLQMAASVR